MKIAYIGGGSHFFESVSIEISQTPELFGSEVYLYDTHPESAELIAAVSRLYSDHYQSDIRFFVCKELAEALEGADVVISSIGVHGIHQCWHQLDVEAVAALGIMQTTGDTVGPTGISQGLRIIPPYLELARAMERYCPESPLLNHSNPMSAICRAITKYTKIQVIGYCHNVAHALTRFSRILEIPVKELDALVGGINHQTWLLSLRHHGKDVYETLKQKLIEVQDKNVGKFSTELVELLDIFLMGGDRHIVEFFPHARIPKTPEEIPYGMEWRRDTITKKVLSDELTVKASELSQRAEGKAPLIILDRLTPEAMGQQIRALKYGPDIIHVVNTPNNGAISNLPPWAVIELKCVVGQHGARPVNAGELPPQAARWTLAQIYSNELLIEAAAEGSRKKALQALACDPMVTNFHEPAKILDALVAAQGERLAPFKK